MNNLVAKTKVYSVFKRKISNRLSFLNKNVAFFSNPSSDKSSSGSKSSKPSNLSSLIPEEEDINSNLSEETPIVVKKTSPHEPTQPIMTEGYKIPSEIKEIIKNGGFVENSMLYKHTNTPNILLFYVCPDIKTNFQKRQTSF